MSDLDSCFLLISQFFALFCYVSINVLPTPVQGNLSLYCFVLYIEDQLWYSIYLFYYLKSRLPRNDLIV